ncbi:DUF6074 family protein [Devosia sp. RR2S18]|uniref:DUF6074 family protein n=1 Tax=Devosia rhizosphaerae TaxID=3049774 RepID=UPI0025413F21|nr:DUF6074 family protein [Devosia sp. RR2S18]WIJ26613.1 DUF6074 family protein [Devosia sp. RR2S18]
MTPEQLELFPGTGRNAVAAEQGSRPSRPEAPLTELSKVKPAPRKRKATTVNWRIPKNSAVPFPVDRQVAYVRMIARALDARDERLAAKYWRTECNRLIGRLQVQGFTADVIAAEVRRFANAVALARRDDDRQQPGGAA